MVGKPGVKEINVLVHRQIIWTCSSDWDGCPSSPGFHICIVLSSSFSFHPISSFSCCLFLWAFLALCTGVLPFLHKINFTATGVSRALFSSKTNLRFSSTSNYLSNNWILLQITSYSELLVPIFFIQVSVSDFTFEEVFGLSFDLLLPNIMKRYNILSCQC